MSQSFMFCPERECPVVIWYDDAKGQEQAITRHLASAEHTQVLPNQPAAEGTNPAGNKEQ